MTENQVLDTQGEASGIHVSTLAQQALRTSANWGTFLAILGFVGIVFMLIAAAGMLVASGLAGDGVDDIYPFPMWIFSVFYLVFAVVYFFPILFLWRFCQGTKRALLSQSSSQLETALINQAKMYKWSGIMVIAIIAIYILGIIGVVLFGMSAMSGL